MSMMRLIRSGFWQMPFRMGFGASSRFNKIDSAATPVHKKHVPGDHWYLLGLGTHPDYQKSGLGSAAINIGAAKAAKAGLPIYLETMTQENVDYYSRRGFRVVEELPIEDKLTIWAMVLDPEKSVRAGS